MQANDTVPKSLILHTALVAGVFGVAVVLLLMASPGAPLASQRVPVDPGILQSTSQACRRFVVETFAPTAVTFLEPDAIASFPAQRFTVQGALDSSSRLERTGRRRFECTLRQRDGELEVAELRLTEHSL